MHDLLQKNVTRAFGSQGALWLERLPSTLCTLQSIWHLPSITPASSMTWNYVGYANHPTYKNVAIKIAPKEELIVSEIQALRYFSGCGVVQLIDVCQSHHAILMKRALPGGSLQTVYASNKIAAMDIYTHALKDLWRASETHFSPLDSKTQQANTQFPHVKEWLSALDLVPSDPLLKSVVKKARAFAYALLKKPCDDTVLHGDLHMDNIISQSESWQIIDPKGVTGPKAFDAACFNFITTQERQSSQSLSPLFKERASYIARALNLDQDVLEQWVFVRLALGVCWALEDQTDAAIFLELIRRIFPFAF